MKPLLTYLRMGDVPVVSSLTKLRFQLDQKRTNPPSTAVAITLTPTPSLM